MGPLTFVSNGVQVQKCPFLCEKPSSSPSPKALGLKYVCMHGSICHVCVCVYVDTCASSSISLIALFF